MSADLSAFEKQLIDALSPRAGLASSILETWDALPIEAVQTAASIAALAQLGVTEERRTQQILDDAASAGLLEKEGSGYAVRPSARPRLSRLALALKAIDFYLREVHRDDTEAQIVLTKPPRPSSLEQELAKLGWHTAGIEPTEHAFIGLVQAAQKRVVVMTPFFDVTGAIWLKELFGQVGTGVERVLILRSLDDPARYDYPQGFASISPWLKATGVSVYNYSIPRIDGPGRETFHAKIVLCDSQSAYIGSSNLNAASLEHSMELGVVLRGRAALDASTVVSAVLRAASFVF